MSKKFKNKVIIEEEIVRKERKSDINELYDYLLTRNFDNFPKIIDSSEEYIKYEYINDGKYHEVTKGVELIKTISMLHYKTLFFKNVSKDKYQKIYDKLNGNIEYLKKYYENIVEDIENTEYMSPSQYLFIRNYSAIDSSLKFASRELDKWFKLVKDKSKERVCVLHNNISLEHFIRGNIGLGDIDKNYLISWDNHMVDTPVLDLYKFYKKEGFKLDFNYLLKTYYETFELLKEEKMILNILISIPPKLDKVNSEYKNTIIVKNLYNYIYSGMNIVHENN